jgi:putative intracellular protease/amidase
MDDKMKKIVVFIIMAMVVLASVTAFAATPSKGKILLVASSENTMELQDHSKMAVGFYLNELAVPAQYLAKQGYEIVMATPSGAKPIMDIGSNSAKFFNNNEKQRQEALYFVNNLKPISLHEAVNELDSFAGIFVPGGHAPMTDLMQDKDLYLALRYFHAQGKPTAMICHGPVALLAALPQATEFRKAMVAGNIRAAMAASKDWQYAGYKMTILSNPEELPGELAKHTQMPFHVEDALQVAGGAVVEQGIYTSHVVRDRELITGQNPASDIALAKEFVKALQGK